MPADIVSILVSLQPLAVSSEEKEYNIYGHTSIYMNERLVYFM